MAPRGGSSLSPPNGLLAASVSQRGSGLLADVVTIQRVDTKGGTADGPCNDAGVFLSVPYATEYTFLKKKP